MRKILLPTAVTLLIISGSAHANDWSGFYAGVHAGYDWTDSRQSLAGTDANGSVLIGFINDLGIATGYSADGGSALGGGQLGINFQSGSLVWGVETDMSHLNTSRSRSDAISEDDDTLTNTTRAKMDWLGTVRLRVGTLLDSNSLIYVTGGLAYARTEASWSTVVSDRDDGTRVLFSGSDKNWSAGWTLGGGAEFTIADGMSLRGEYLYYDLGDTDSAIRVHENFNEPVGLKLESENTGHVVRAVLNFQIGK